MNKRKSSEILDEQNEKEDEFVRVKSSNERSQKIILVKNNDHPQNEKKEICNQNSEISSTFMKNEENLKNIKEKQKNILSEKDKIIKELNNKINELIQDKIKKDLLIVEIKNEANEKIKFKDNVIENLTEENKHYSINLSNLKKKYSDAFKQIDNLTQIIKNFNNSNNDKNNLLINNKENNYNFNDNIAHNINNNFNNNNLNNNINNNFNNNLINNNINNNFDNNLINNNLNDNFNNNNINNFDNNFNDNFNQNINNNNNINLNNNVYNLCDNNNMFNQNIINNVNNNNINNFNNNANNLNQNNQRANNFIEININQKNEKIQPIQKYIKPPLIGLQNIGATCFMNSTLQCLSQTKRLTNYFLDEKHREKIQNNNIFHLNPNEYQLSPVYLELIENLWNDKGPSYYAPYNFMNRVNDMNPLFKKGEAGDAKDFIIFVLEQMHKELKKSLNPMNNLNEAQPLNQYDKNNTFINFFNEFMKETSILSDLFFGFNETTNICLNCKNYFNARNSPNPICYNYGIFNVLIFPLEEVKNLKNYQNMNNIQNFYQGPTDIVDIDDCFIYNQKTDLFTGENKNYCNICKQLSDSYYTSRIFVSPNILILILNRGKGNIYKVKMDFAETIDITNYVLQREKIGERLIYNLYGVITHIGESGPNAHFIASCKSPVDGFWYRFNDAIIEPIKDFKKDVYDFCSPYILFYEKVE